MIFANPTPSITLGLSAAKGRSRGCSCSMAGNTDPVCRGVRAERRCATVDDAPERTSCRIRMEVQGMSKAEFTALLVEFTATHHCSRNWLETVVEWVRTSNVTHERLAKGES